VASGQHSHGRSNLQAPVEALQIREPQAGHAHIIVTRKQRSLAPVFLNAPRGQQVPGFSSATMASAVKNAASRYRRFSSSAARSGAIGRLPPAGSPSPGNQPHSRSRA
jgi:hypothetical protein